MSDREAPLVFETPGGLSVEYRGRLLYSARMPAALPVRIAAACDRGPSRLHLVPSPLLWYGARELLGSMGPGSALLFVETDPLLAALARERMPPELAEDLRVSFIETASIAEIVTAARRMGNFRSCSLVQLSGGPALDAQAYEAMASALQSEFEASWRNRAALMVLGPRWARNIFDNIAALESLGIERMPSLPGAVLVCGAGPSLEEALPFARSRRAELRLVACDTALGTLLASGLEPDLVICLEGQAHNLADFTCLGSKAIPLVADISSHPSSFRAVRGRKHLTFARIWPSPFLSRVESALVASGTPFLPMPPLGSVGVHAVHLARALSDGPILAAGLDFSFELGKTHARGCPSLLAEERRLNRLTRWQGQYSVSFRDRNLALDGGRLTDPTLLSYASLLAEGEGAGRGLYDLRSKGPSIGGRRLDQAQAGALLDAQPAKIESPTRQPGCDGSKVGGTARSILSGEASRLEALRLSMRGQRILPRSEFRRLVLESDYLWWGFPDQDRAAELPQDFLNRLVPQVEYWAYRLGRLMEAAGTS
jgi:hypothetical protein